MAKVKITGHASGSGVLTITAPNTSTDRTVTLPDSTGTLLDTTSGLDATKLSGNLPAISGASLTGIAAKQNLGSIPMDGYDKLFLKSNTTDGSTTFVDTSPSKHTLTANGNVSHQTEQKYFGTSSMQFDGTGDFISMPASHDFDLLGEDFTISFWWRPTNNKTQFFFSHASDHHIAMSMYPGQKLGLWASSNGSSWNIINADGGGNGIGTTAMQINTWYHLAFVRKGDNWRGYVNGVKEIEVTSTASITASHNEAFSVGNHGSSGSNDIHGFIDDFRWSKGVARYTEDFTLPTGSIGSLEHSAGDVVQVIYFESTGGTNDNGTIPFQDTHLAATITPQYSNSKIIASANCQMYMNNTSGECSMAFDFKRAIAGGATTSNISGDTANSTAQHRSIGNGELTAIVPYRHVEVINTTSAITYTLQYAGQGSANTIVGWQSKADSLMLMEIKV